MGLQREYLDDISAQRFQENVAKKFTKDEQKGIHGAMGDAVTNKGDNVFVVTHSLGAPPSSFIILTHTSPGSIKATLKEGTSTTATIKFEKDPGTFTIFFS